MAHTREEKRSDRERRQFTSPTAEAPILAGFDGEAEAPCPVLVVPHSREV